MSFRIVSISRNGTTFPITGNRIVFVLDGDRKSTRLNSSHGYISYAVFCLKKKKRAHRDQDRGPRAHLEARGLGLLREDTRLRRLHQPFTALPYLHGDGPFVTMSQTLSVH